MQYFVQAFGVRQPYPDKYDLLMDIATEEFSHLEIVGATITGVEHGRMAKAIRAAGEMQCWAESRKSQVIVYRF